MVDKLYIMLPEFRIKEQVDVKAAWDAFYLDKDNADIVDEIDANIGIAWEDYLNNHPEDDLSIDEYEEYLFIDKGLKRYQFSAKAKQRFKEWIKEHKKEYIKGYVIEKIKYDYSKAPQEQSLEARNNAIIDIMFGILTSPDSASQILTPGGFDMQKSAARIVDILDAMTEEQLKKEGLTRESLLTLPLDKLNKLAARYKTPVNPLSPRTQVIFHQQNMTGGTMIGIYANHNANHAMMQHTKRAVNERDGLAVNERDGAFTFNGKVLTSLTEIKNDNGSFISSNTANYLAASVDNVKDNTLHSTNQNTFTGDATMLLSRLGYTPIEIAILMRQPIVMEMTRRFFRESREGKTKEEIIKSVINKAQEIGENKGIEFKHIRKNAFTIEELMENLQNHKNVSTMDETSRRDFYRKQVAVGLLFQRIMKTADALSDVVAATRADTANGGAGPTIADTAIKLHKVDDLLEALSNSHYPLINFDIIREIDITKKDGKIDVDSLREALLESKLPMIQAFYTLGLRQTERIMSEYFPHFTTAFKDVVDTLRNLTKTGRLNVKTLNSIYNDAIAFILSGSEFFGSHITKDGKVITAQNKRRAFINNFPAEFEKIKSNNPDIAKLEFIQRLTTVKSNQKVPVPLLVFKNAGSLTPTLRDRYTRDWASLLYMENPEAPKLAVNLFLYSYFRGGFAFGPSSFIHLAPTIVRQAIPGYVENLRSILTDPKNLVTFPDMYIYNHLDNRSLVPEISSSSSLKFVINDKVQDTVTAFGEVNTEVVRKKFKIDGEIYYDYQDYIAKRVNNDYVYYRLLEADDETGSAIYTRIEPLGLTNNFLEYDAYSDALSMTSVIDRSKKNVEINPSLDSMDSHIDYDTAPVFSQEEIDSVFDRAVNAAGIKDSEDMNSMTPNKDFKDADRKYLCEL